MLPSDHIATMKAAKVAIVALMITTFPAAAAEPMRTSGDREWEAVAVWYQVPVHSLARRRAGANELTAAHDRLPIGTRVRVTRLSNGQDVIVRITDCGVNHRRATIDLCREAAQQLRMIRAGISRVRIEIIPETSSGNAADEGSVGLH